MAVDDSFKKPGAVPFKWEIKPGVPKSQQNHLHRKPTTPSSPPSRAQTQSCDHRRSSELNSLKLRPPPAGYYVLPPVEPRTRSFRASPRVRSDRWRFEKPLLARPESVSTGCFFSPLLRRVASRKRIQKPVVAEDERESDYTSELETLARWSLSSRKSLSPFRDSTTSSSSRSNQSSPRPVRDVEWAGFGLF